MSCSTKGLVKVLSIRSAGLHKEGSTGGTWSPKPLQIPGNIKSASLQVASSWSSKVMERKTSGLGFSGLGLQEFLGV